MKHHKLIAKDIKNSMVDLLSFVASECSRGHSPLSVAQKRNPESQMTYYNEPSIIYQSKPKINPPLNFYPRYQSSLDQYNSQKSLLTNYNKEYPLTYVHKKWPQPDLRKPKLHHYKSKPVYRQSSLHQSYMRYQEDYYP